MLNRSPLWPIVAAFAIVVGLSCASTSQAQSGRRTRKTTTPEPVATPEPTPTPAASVSSPRQKPRVTFLVGLDSYDGFSNIPSYAYEGVLRHLTERLADSRSVEVAGVQTDMNRGDAIQRAKKDPEAYVVWIQLRDDSMNRDSRNSGNLDNIVIEYSVFAPNTGKQATSGRTYTQSQRNKGILNPRSSSIYGDRLLNMAAQEAADRILAYFQLRVAPTRLP